MADASLLTDEVRSFIGRTTDPVTVQVTRAHVRRALLAVTGSAEGLPAEGEPAPAFGLAALEGDTEPLATPSILPSGVLSATEWALERPLLVGEELTAVRRIADVSERLGGRYGHSLYFRVEVEYRDAAGAMIARSSLQTTQFDPEGAGREVDE